MPKQQSTLWKHMYFRHAYSQLSPLQEKTQSSGELHESSVYCRSTVHGIWTWDLSVVETWFCQLHNSNISSCFVYAYPLKDNLEGSKQTHARTYTHTHIQTHTHACMRAHTRTDKAETGPPRCVTLQLKWIVSITQAGAAYKMC